MTALWITQDKKEPSRNNDKSVVLRDSIDIWSDTLLYWNDVSTISLQKSWTCENPDEYNKQIELYNKADSMFYLLLDSCEKQMSKNDYSLILDKVVTNQVHI